MTSVRPPWSSILCRVWALIDVLVSAMTVPLLAGTTTVIAANFTYDCQADSPIGTQAVDLFGARPAQLRDVREWAAPPFVDARGTATTPSAMRNATKAVPPGGNRAIAIGEDMEGRAIPKAKELGADYYAPPSAPPSQWMENNRKWLNNRMDEGCTIYDCGPAPGRTNYPNAE